MHHCNNVDVMKKQAAALKTCIDEQKWFMSEKVGHDVGLEEATNKFFDTYFFGFSAGWRIAFCFNCPNNKDCSVGSKYSTL